MVAVNACAIEAYDAFRKGVDPPNVDVSGRTRACTGYKLALPPMNRKKQRAGGTFSTSHNTGLPLVIRDVAATTAGGTWIYADGSYTPQRGDNDELCGWAFCVVAPQHSPPNRKVVSKLWFEHAGKRWSSHMLL